MKRACKKLFSLLLVAVLLISAIPFQAFAAETVQLRIMINGNILAGYPKDVTTGAVISTMIPTNATLQTEYNALKSDGAVIDGLYFTTGAKKNEKVDATKVLSADMAESGLVIMEARFVQPDVTVTLNANGGTVAYSTVAYKRYETYGAKLPTPERPGYAFAGWFANLNDATTQALNDTVISGNTTLYAKWTAGSLPVVFQGWNGTDWTEVSRANPTTGKSLSQSGLSLPIMSSSYTNRVGYSVDETNPWVDSNGNVFTANTVVNAVTYVRPNLKPNTYKIHYNYNCEELASKSVEVKFDSKVNLEQPTRANHVFVRWEIGGTDPARELKTGDTYAWAGDITLYAVWAPKGTVELRVYRDDAEGFKTYYYSGAVLGGELNLNNCKIQNYLSGTYDFDGWYDYNGWVTYLGTRASKGVAEASQITRLEKITTSNTTNSTVTVIYGMVRNYKATNTGNNNSSTTAPTTKPVDKTNPATGDNNMIEIMTTTMLVSAAALALFVAMRKKKVM